MEIVVTGRHIDVKERFRRHVEDKLDKVTQFAPRVQRIDVEVSHEKNRRQASSCERVEITVRDKGPVVRAEACADDPYAALDLAATKLMERLRRSRDRRKIHHGRHRPVSVHQATAGLSDEALVPTDPSSVLEDGERFDHVHDPDTADATPAGAPPAGSDGAGALGDSPVIIREKVHDAVPMTLDQALYEMELVGHDFFLFVDAASRRPSVVYRRRGWDYGVLHLDVHEADGGPALDGTVHSDASLAAVVGARG